jgi:pimeloyl-ACP methyl ester carboxylesterase
MVQALRYVPLDLMRVVMADTFRVGLIKTLTLGQELSTRDITAKLACIRASTLVIWGEQDTIVPLKLGARLNAYLPNSQLLIIKEAGHVPMWERPETFNQEVLDFLAPQPALLAKSRR